MNKDAILKNTVLKKPESILFDYLFALVLTIHFIITHII